MNHTKQNTAPTEREAGGIAHFSFRLGMDRWMDENRFQEFLTMLDGYPNIADQLSLFTSESHPPLPLPVIRERMEIASVQRVWRFVLEVLKRSK